MQEPIVPPRFDKCGLSRSVICSRQMLARITNLTLILLALFLDACTPSSSKPEGPAVVIQGDTVRFATNALQLSSLAIEPVSNKEPALLSLTGRLSWNENATVRVFAPFTGIVRKIFAEVNQAVSKGAPLASIQSADFGQAQADAQKAESNLQHSQQNLARLRELTDHGAAPRRELESAEADFASAEAERDRAHERLAIYGAPVSSTNQEFLLPSPLEGILVERNVTPGQEVRPDQMLANTPQITAPLFVVSDPSRLWIQIDATETDLPLLRPGSKFSVTSRAFPGQFFAGKVDVVSQFIDPATRTIRIQGEVENPRRQLKAEMFVNLNFPDPAAQEEASVPLKAVFLKGNKHYAFVADEPWQFTRQEVQVGPETGDRILVLAGLQVGQRVVTDGCILLQHLMK
jgi:cobalt-zinc-cadmium efflux system membrane fusion protein